MHRYQLEHALRAARRVTGEDEFIIIGSSALLGSYPFPPPELSVSLEVDLYPRRAPARGAALNSIGELSPFHETHGFWIDPVGPETASLPAGWESRLVAVQNANTDLATGWCLEVHDLAVSKLLAGREKDLSFIGALLAHGMIREETLRARTESTDVEPEQKTLAEGRITALSRGR